MTQKLSFTVENVEVFEEKPNSNFAVMSLDFFASGDNLHDLYVSEETLHNTADTIKNCPLVWIYDEVLDDIYTHDIDEVPCGFVPEKFPVTSRKLDDGRTMLTAIAYVWKRYTGQLLEIFARDDGKKPVSVEMVINSMKRMESGMMELLDFEYHGITLLGSFITPAIPGANASVLSFSSLAEDYEKDYIKEFSSDSSEDTEEAMTKKKVDAQVADEQEDFAKKEDDKEVGEEEMGCGEDKKDKDMSKDSEDKPEEDMAKSEDKPEDKPEKDMAKSEDKPEDKPEEDKEDMAKPEDKPEDKPEEDMAKEGKKDDKEDEDEKDEKPFSFGEDVDVEKLSAIFGEDSVMSLELAKGKDADSAVLLSEMFAKLFAVSTELVSMSSEKDALVEFKSDVEKKSMEFEVNATLKTLSDSVEIPQTALEEMLADSAKYSIDTIDEWKTNCKAKSFDFAVKSDSTSDVVKIGVMPFEMTRTEKQENDLWSASI